MKKVLLIHPDKCIGCRTCEAVCALYHDGVINLESSRISVARYEQVGINLPVACANCDDPACAAVCPTGALDPTGNKLEVNYTRCVGCRMCVMACPIGGISFDPVAQRIVRCDQCGGDPQCVKFCPQGAIEYIDAGQITSGKRRNVADRLLGPLVPGGGR